MTRHLLSIDDLSRDDIERILGRAESFAEVSGREIKKVPTLRGRTVINLFYEASTRTQLELRAGRQAAERRPRQRQVGGLGGGQGRVAQGHRADAVRLRPGGDRDPLAARGRRGLVARWTRAAVINAGDGKHEHPTQALLDLYTLQRRAGSLEGLKIWIVGDVLHSRVARSGILAFTRMGCEVTVCGPPTLIPRGIESLGCAVRYTLDELRRGRRGLRAADAARADDGSFVPSLREYAAQYQIDGRRLGRTSS